MILCIKILLINGKIFTAIKRRQGEGSEPPPERPVGCGRCATDERRGVLVMACSAFLSYFSGDIGSKFKTKLPSFNQSDEIEKENTLSNAPELPVSPSEDVAREKVPAQKEETISGILK